MNAMQASEQFKALFSQKLKAANYQLSAKVQVQLLDYLFLLDKWNQAYNLTSVRDMSAMIPLHILDSLSIVNYVQGDRIIDVGTGAGLPGIPLAIFYPERKVVLLDSNGKKTRFLTHVLAQLNLTNVTVVQARVESYQSKNCFDTVISRAFSQLNDFVVQTQHLCCEDGIFLAMKGQYPQEELKTLKGDYELAAVHSLNIIGLSAQRHLVCLQKKTSKN